MSLKIAINKEIVLLRKNVEQAKVCIIKKRTREATKMRAKTGEEKKGTPALKEKFKRKADAIVAEIKSIKNMKNDDITKYVLTHTLNFKDVVNDRNSDALSRMMARLANHKTFSDKIADFKKKYPDYMEYLGPGRKKKALLEWKEKKKLKKKGLDVEKDDSDKESENEKSEESDVSGEEESSEGKDDAESDNEPVLNDAQQSESENEESEEEESSIEKVSAKKVKSKSVEETKSIEKVSTKKVKSKVEEEKNSKEKPVKNVENKVEIAKEDPEESEKIESVEISKTEKSKKRTKATSEVKDDAPKSKKSKKQKKTDIPKVISKQAVVKKFTDILKEDESHVDKEEIDSEPAEPKIQVEKEEDPFFFTGDGQSNYLSVAPLKNVSDNRMEDDDDDEDDYRGNRFNQNKFSRQDPGKYFSNVSKFNNNNNNNKFKKSDERWDAPKRNGRSYDKEKPGRNAKFSKFNDEQRDKSKPFNKPWQSKGGIESKSNEILHPSWEAKKKQQEALKKGFQGKKIVFGDDDV